MFLSPSPTQISRSNLTDSLQMLLHHPDIALTHSSGLMKLLNSRDQNGPDLSELVCLVNV